MEFSHTRNSDITKCFIVGVDLRSIHTLCLGNFLFCGQNAYLWLELDAIHALLGQTKAQGLGESPANPPDLDQDANADASQI